MGWRAARSKISLARSGSDWEEMSFCTRAGEPILIGVLSSHSHRSGFQFRLGIEERKENDGIIKYGGKVDWRRLRITAASKVL